MSSLALLLALWLPTQSIALEGPDASPRDRLVELQLSGEFDDADWEAVAVVAGAWVEGDGRELDPKGGSYVFTGPPGSYRVKATATVAGRMVSRAKVVTIGDVAPPVPPPGPTPGPTPPDPQPPPVPPSPTPYTGKLWVLYVAEPNDVAAWSLAANAAVRKGLELLKADLRTYKTTEEDIARLNLTGVVRQAAGKPVAVVIREDGKVAATIINPTSPDNLVAPVLKIREGR